MFSKYNVEYISNFIYSIVMNIATATNSIVQLYRLLLQMWHGQTQTGLVVGTATSTAATGLVRRRLSEKRSQRKGEGSDARAE